MDCKRHQKKWTSMLKVVLPVLMLLGMDASTVNGLHYMNLDNEPSLLSADQILPGKCKYKPGDLKSKLSPDFKVSENGIWRNIYDDKRLNDQYKCQTVRIQSDEKEKANPRLKYEMASGYHQDQRFKLWELGHEAAFNPYIFNGRSHMNFTHKTDPTIAYLESSRIDHNYLNWAQVLDFQEAGTHKAYFTLYSCMQSAKYFDVETGKQQTYNQMQHVGLDSDKVRVEEYYMERVQVLEKIDIQKLHRQIVTNSTIYQKGLPYHKMPEIKKTISEVLPSFTQEFLEKHYDLQEQYGNSETPMRDGETLDQKGEWWKILQLYQKSACQYAIFSITDPKSYLYDHEKWKADGIYDKKGARDTDRPKDDL